MSLEPTSDPIAITRLLREEAERAGFHRFGVAPAAPIERYAKYEAWIASGYAAEMRYLVEQGPPRRDPREVLAAARSVVTVGLSYARPEPPATGNEDTPRAFVARYARGADYHTVMKRRLQKMAEAVGARLGRAIAWTACVDTAPVLERELAHRGGVGFLAKNTMVIAPGLGSLLMLGELLVDAEAAPTDGAEPRCGRCRACLDACPTGAFVDAYELDARRCISYLTIEHAGPIPRELRPKFENMVFGCDRCQEVCPFNAPAERGDVAFDESFLPSPRRDRPSLAALVTIGAAQFRKLQEKSAMRRIHRAQLVRNAAVALGNVGGPSEVPSLVAALQDASPLVRGHAAWALGAIGKRHSSTEQLARGVLEARRITEEDDSAREEMDAAIAELSTGARPV